MDSVRHTGKLLRLQKHRNGRGQCGLRPGKRGNLAAFRRMRANVDEHNRAVSAKEIRTVRFPGERML